MESGTHIINVTSTSMPEMNPTLAFVNLKVAKTNGQTLQKYELYMIPAVPLLP